MAKRSDFAQKLLDDLRLRKERMAASQTRSSKSSKPIAGAGDAYSYSKQAYRGSREMKTHQTTGFRNGNSHHRAGGNKSLSIREASNEIVPFGRGRNSEQIGDLSMALAFALENGGKLRRMDSSGSNSMLGFLSQIGRQQPVDLGKMGRITIERHGHGHGHGPATNRFPTFSHLHIEEISKGAQKLNQILRACSNGLNFDRYSIEIGKELLKGAMDLEESLRMLVNLQEASEYMITPQSKTRITLLDEDEDEEDDYTVTTAQTKQLARPIFSFDKSSRNSHYIQEAARIDLKHRRMAQTYQSKTTNFSHDAHNLSTSKSASHRRSASHSPNMKNSAAFSEHKDHLSSSISKPEKGRIPNVIAKLMGLEELPENDDSKKIAKKEPNSREKMERTVIKKTAEGSITHERRTKDAGNLASPIRKHKQIQSNQIQVTQDTLRGLQAERNIASHQASFEGTIHDGKPPQKDVEGTKVHMRNSNNANMKIDKLQSNRNQSSLSVGSRKDILEKERKRDNTKLREHNGKAKDESKELILKHQLQQMPLHKQNGSEAAITMKEKAEYSLTMVKTERRDIDKLPSSNQSKSLNNLALQQPQMLQNLESQKHYVRESEQQIVKEKIQVSIRTKDSQKHDSMNLLQKHLHKSQPIHSNGSSTESIGRMQSMGVPNERGHGDFLQDTSYHPLNDNMQDSVNKNSIQNPSTRDLNPESVKELNRAIISPDTEERPTHVPFVQKVKFTKSQKSETPRKIDELAVRKSGNPHNLSRTPKHQTSILQEVKQRRQHKLSHPKEEAQVGTSRSTEVRILKSNRTVSGTQQSNKLEEVHSQAEQASNLRSPADDEQQSLKVRQTPAPNKNSLKMMNNQQGQERDFGVDKLSSHISISDLLHQSEGAQMKSKKVSIKLETVEPLTEIENHLKQILIKSQLFLNTAEALFKLNIPFDILNTGGPDCHDAESKLLLDCGYEVMKRKGKKQELSGHPLMRINISTTWLKVRSLDELIKQLHKDFDKLRIYGRNGKAECIVEDYLAKMLESDVYDKDPDVNCMWDIGWQEMFTCVEKDDVVRDVEKHLLNGLLDEVIRDLLLLFSSN